MSAAIHRGRVGACGGRERGAILAVSLMLLLVLTVLAVASLRLSTSNERMAGNVRDVDLSFQSTEAGIREAEQRVLRATDAPPTCAGPCALTNGVLPERSIPDPAIDPAAFEAFWAANVQTYGSDSVRQMSRNAADPGYLVEYHDFVPDELGGAASGILEGRDVYRVVARGEGGTDVAQTIIETTVARR